MTAPRTPLYVTPPPDSRLRVAFVVGSGLQERWIGQALRRLRNGGIAEVVAIVHAPGREAETAAGPLGRLYRGLDHLLHGGRPSALARVDLRDWAPGAEVLAPNALSSSVVEKLAALGLDAIVSLLAADLPGELAAAARLGVWSCRYGSHESPRRDEALLSDLARGGAPHALVVSVRQSSPAGELLRERCFALRPESVWLGKHLEAAASRAAHTLVRSLRRVALGDADPPPESAPEPAAPPLDRPGMAGFALRSIVGLARKKWTRARHEDRWLLAYRSDPSRFVCRAPSPDLSGFERIEPPTGRFHADPNLFTRDGVDYLFFEDWDDRLGRASIGVLAFDAEGRPGERRTALALDHHLSYPFLFEWEGEAYLLPEMSGSGALTLFRARRFPDDWERCCDLLSGWEAADATLHAHAGRWYLFATVREEGGSLKDDLFLFHAEKPLGPFRPHPRNPIRSDVRSARPAGRLFRRGGKLLRPAQDCSTSYGAAIQLCEVLALSETRYAERNAGRLEPPDADLEGCHTLTFSDRLEVIDVRRSVRRADLE